MTLLNSFISSKVYFTDSLGFSIQTTMSTKNREIFTFFLFDLHAFNFLLFISLARTSSIILNKRSKRDILAFFLILEEKHSIFHH